MKTRIGIDAGNITTNMLRGNIHSSWIRYADTMMPMTDMKCLDPEKRRIASYLGKQEAKILYKVSDPSAQIKILMSFIKIK